MLIIVFQVKSWYLEYMLNQHGIPLRNQLSPSNRRRVRLLETSVSGCASATWHERKHRSQYYRRR